MNQYTNLNLYGHLALELGADNDLDGYISNADTSDISFLRFTGFNPVVHGLDPGYNSSNNKVLIITFVGTGKLIFKNLSDQNSSNNYRIKTPNSEDFIVPLNYGAILIYDSYDNFWHIVGEAKLAAGSDGQIQFNNSGSLKGNSNLTWDANNNILNVSGSIYSTVLFDNGKRVATLTGTETFENKTLVSPIITGSLTFGNIPFYEYGNQGLSVFENINLSNSSLQTAYNFGTPSSQTSNVLSLSIKDQYRTFLSTSGTNTANVFDIGSTSNNTTFKITKNNSIQPVDVSGGTTLIQISPSGQVLIPNNILSTSHTTGSLVVSGGIGIGGESYFNDNLNLLSNKTLKFYDNDSSNFIGIKSPSDIATNYTYTLPPIDGVSGQVLSTDGSGSLSFISAGSQNHNDLSNIQGGGNSNYYHSNQPINITNTVQFAGLNINGAYSLPTSDGLEDQVITTNGSGTLTFKQSTSLKDRYINSNSNIFKSERILADTSSGSISLTLPANPSNGDIIGILDVSGTFTTNNVSLLRNNKKINGFSEDYTLDINSMYLELHYYVDSWRFLEIPLQADFFYSMYNFGNISTSSNLNLSNVKTMARFNHTNATSSVINLTDGEIGRTYKIIVASNGQQYSFSSISGLIRWPSNIAPIISENGKSDLFIFECIATDKYLGYYVENYDSTNLF